MAEGNMQIPVIHSYPTWLHQTQTWMYTQVKYLPASIDTHIVCHRTANLEQFQVANIHALSEAPIWRWYWEKGLRKLGIQNYIGLLKRVAQQQKAAIIHTHFGNYGWEDVGVAQKVNAVHVVTFYGADVNKLPRQDPRWLKKYSRLFEEVSLVLCEGPHMGACVEALGCPGHKIRVQHLGIELEKHRYTPRKWQPGTPLKILIAASFREKKGIPYGLKALARLKDKLPIEITIIGDAGSEASSQKEKQHILKTIETSGLTPFVKMLGYQSHQRLIEETFKNHVFLAPSVTARDGDTEGGAPVSIIEMMAAGMPVVSTTHCDIPHIITHKKTGLLASERNVDELVDCLRWLTGNPEKWNDLTQNARRWIENEYDAHIQGEKLAALYASVLPVSQQKNAVLNTSVSAG